MQYRITVKDSRLSGGESVHEVEAESLTQAIFLVGTEYGTVAYPEVLTVIKAEIPAGWMEVALP